MYARPCDESMTDHNGIHSKRTRPLISLSESDPLLNPTQDGARTPESNLGVSGNRTGADVGRDFVKLNGLLYSFSDFGTDIAIFQKSKECHRDSV